MSVFSRFKKTKEPETALDTGIYAPADGEQIDITTVPDEVFASKMMGESMAFRYDGDNVMICSPADGTLSVLYPTGHAFGIRMSDGTELLVHIGIDTVSAQGSGFDIQKKKQGETVRTGDPIVRVNLASLRPKYDMSTMLIVTNPGNRQIHWIPDGSVRKGQSLLK